MTDFLWPADLAPYRCAYYLQAHVGGSESPFSRTTKTYGLSRPRWVARYTFRGGFDNPRRGAEGFARRLDVLLAEAEGTARFALWDFRRENPFRQQFFAASPTSLGGASGATTIQIAGFMPHAVAFTIGDYVGLGDGRAHLVTGPTTQIVANESGVAQITFKPGLLSAVASGTAVTTRRVTSWFRLARDSADDAAATEMEVGGLAEHSLTFVEDFAGA